MDDKLSPFARSSVAEAVVTVTTQDRIFIEAIKRVVNFSPEDGEKDIMMMFAHHWEDIADGDLQTVQRLFFRLDAIMRRECDVRNLPKKERRFSCSQFSVEEVADELALDVSFLADLMAVLAAMGVTITVPEVL